MDKTMSGEPMTLKVINMKNSSQEKYFFNTWSSKNAMQCSHTTTF